MFKRMILFSFISMFAFGSFSLSVLAQEENEAALTIESQEAVSVGILPDSPFYFFKTLGEDIRTFFTFDALAKAQRYAELAQLRITEMQAMTEQNKTKNMEKAVERYQNQIEKSVSNLIKAQERNREQEKEKINQLSENIAQDAEKYNAILDGGLGELSQKIKLKIRQVKNVSNDIQIQAIKLLVKENPEKAMEIFSTATENRLRKIEVGIDYDDTESADDAVEQYNKYSSFGQEISEMAKGIRIGETTVEELVNKATSNHLQVLEQVRERVNEQAKVKIEEAIEKSKEVKVRVEEQIRNREESGNSDEGNKNMERNEEQSQIREENGVCDTDNCVAGDSADESANENSSGAGANTGARSGQN
ncbi:hypothetical protein KKD72_00845 [Patescibacteria group bacterium]|nr:hypothetical protein [Patescibacteria group bacterium]